MSNGFCNGQADSTLSQLLKSALDAAGFSFAEIEFKRRSEIFFTRLNKLLCAAADTIYVGSRSEGILGGLYYSGEESDIDAILPFFEEYDVYDGQSYLDEGIEKPDINEDPWEYITGYHTLLCSRKTFFAFYDEEFPGYMMIYCLPNTRFSSSKVHARATHVYIENKQFQHLVRKTDAQDLNITTETTNQFQTNGPAVTEECFSSCYFFSSKQESLVSDNVPCLYFDYWPPCAYDWTTRFKPNGWPEDRIIKQIVSHKCMLAPVGHHDSSDKDVQFRLSITGENILFQHLNNVQVHCYILLKIILKDKLRPILNSDNKDILSSYCMKNVIFWCVERESVDWTVSNLVCCLQICIRKLILYLQEYYLPHYIIKSYDAFGRKKQRNDILTKINHLSPDDIAVENNQVLFYNILVYCNSKAGYNQRAAKYLVRSLVIFPSQQNAAFGYLKDIVHQSLTLIRTWNANAM
ncbi:unnamed protein product [Mytilus coruscus]|uniref:Mab-21-like HhH/H2TH-like domain-containing protein n=1 Tax=Mytilus coruscus TaxID=42192 RepID=A0A6J8EAH4_MYTCO|nr:unnamed protein product [Mytilus coruscus]